MGCAWISAASSCANAVLLKRLCGLHYPSGQLVKLLHMRRLLQGELHAKLA
jgi:hypothetical protein